MCRQIPAWAFKKVALRWKKVNERWHVQLAGKEEDPESCPAPTVQEIWKDLASPKNNNIYEMTLTEPLAYVVRYMHCDGLDEDGQPINEHDVTFIGDFFDGMAVTMLKAWCQFHQITLDENKRKME